jgi:hypothetical protein
MSYKTVESRLLSPTLDQRPVVHSPRNGRRVKRSPGQRPRPHHIGLAPPRHLRRSEQQQATAALRQWVGTVDDNLLSADIGGRPLFDPDRYCRVRPSDALQYYALHPDELPPDMLLCHAVCPVFVLHACAALLRSDADVFHQSQETLVLLHCLKRRLSRPDTCAFLRRLFALCEAAPGYEDGMTRYSHYLAVVAVFMTSNVDFVRRLGATGYHKLCVDDIKRAGAIQDLLVDNLLVNERVNAWTRLYVRLQMEAHCARLEFQWMQYYRCPRDSAKPFAPVPLVLELPQGGNLPDADALAKAVQGNPAVRAMYVTSRHQ